jgi:hypothetical protein
MRSRGLNSILPDALETIGTTRTASSSNKSTVITALNPLSIPRSHSSTIGLKRAQTIARIKVRGAKTEMKFTVLLKNAPPILRPTQLRKVCVGMDSFVL